MGSAVGVSLFPWSAPSRAEFRQAGGVVSSFFPYSWGSSSGIAFSAVQFGQLFFFAVGRCFSGLCPLRRPPCGHIGFSLSEGVQDSLWVVDLRLLLQRGFVHSTGRSQLTPSPGRFFCWPRRTVNGLFLHTPLASRAAQVRTQRGFSFFLDALIILARRDRFNRPLGDAF